MLLLIMLWVIGLSSWFSCLTDDVLLLFQAIREQRSVCGVRPHDPGQRVRDAGGSGAARVPPQVFRVQQVRSAAGARGPLLPAGRQSGVRAGLAQAAQGLGGVGTGGAQGQGGPAAAESGLRHRSVHYIYQICPT